MKVCVRTEAGELKSVEVDDSQIQPALVPPRSPKLRLTSPRGVQKSLTEDEDFAKDVHVYLRGVHIPHEIISICVSFLTPRDVCALSLVNTSLWKVTSANKFWLPFCLRDASVLFPKGTPTSERIERLKRQRNIFMATMAKLATSFSPTSVSSLVPYFTYQYTSGWRAFYIRKKECWSKIKYVWARLKRFQPFEVVNTLHPGASPREILETERIMFKNLEQHLQAACRSSSSSSSSLSSLPPLFLELPYDVRCSFMIHNGEAYVDYGKGFVNGMMLLSLNSMALEYIRCIGHHDPKKLSRTSPASIIATVPSGGDTLTYDEINSLFMVPLTNKMGTEQYFVDVRTAKIYLVTGWSAHCKANNWLEFLFGLLDSIV